MRALVVLYHGNEISENSLQQIKYLISTDYNAIGQDIVCIELNSTEIAQLSAEAAAKTVAENIPHLRINVQDSVKKPSRLDLACQLIAQHLKPSKDAEVEPLKVVTAYLTDKRIHTAINIIASARQNQIDNNPVAIGCGINGEFLKMLRKIAKEL